MLVAFVDGGLYFDISQPTEGGNACSPWKTGQIIVESNPWIRLKGADPSYRCQL